jgi:transcriptional regulator with XRE-family HTH domain
MALFFDAVWFDARLDARGLSRATLAAICGLSEAEVALLFKDQREMSPGEVAMIAELLGASAAEVAEHAGVSTRAPAVDPIEARLRSLEARIAALEAALAHRGGDEEA